MKNLLCSIVLLWLAVTVAQGQALTLDQLILLRSKEIINVDDYLVSRHWRFVSASSLNDSTKMSFWVFDDARNRRMAELTYRETTNRPTVVIYSTPNRLYFNDAKVKIAAYHMEYLGQETIETAAWTYFRGATYDVLLSIRPMLEENYRTWYTVQVQRHGMVKLYYKKDDGTETAFWFDAERYRELDAERRERLRVQADSAAHQ